jgi:hypothetical protein
LLAWAAIRPSDRDFAFILPYIPGRSNAEMRLAIGALVVQRDIARYSPYIPLQDW